MNKIFAIALMMAAGGAMAGPTLTVGGHGGGLASMTNTTTPVFEAAGRKGSHRVGGSGRSGKGGRYVGGRR